MPRVSDLSQEQWKEIEQLAVAGMSYKDIGERYDIEPGTIAVRAHRKEWAVPERVERLRKELAANQLKQADNVKESNVTLHLAENLTEIGERNALRVAKYTENKLKEAIEGDFLPAPNNWKDFSTANRTNADATGRNRPQQAVQVNVWGSDSGTQDAIVADAETDDGP